MSYIVSIKTALWTFPIIAFLFTIPFILYQYHKYGSINILRCFIIYSFILYLITIYFLIILPLPNRKTLTKPTKNMIKLIPFGFIRDFIKETSFVLTKPSTYLKSLTEPCFYTVIFNIFMMVPFGMYLRYYFQCNLKKIIKFSFRLSLFFELTQLTRLYFIYPYPYRVFDVDDLIMNTLGGIVGYFLMGVILKYLPTRREIDKQSLERAKVVSGLRRMMVFWLDIFLYILLCFLIYFLVGKRNIKYVVFVIYYFVFPYFSNGLTWGSLFLNVRLEYPNYSFFRNSFRVIFLYIYYFYMPYQFLFIVSFLKSYFHLGVSTTIWLWGMCWFVIFVFYGKNIFTILKKKGIYYDAIFKVRYKNTLESRRGEG